MKGKIIYMEDDKFFADVLSKKLQGAGFEVAVAPDGEEGLSVMHREKFDLLLLDLLMPKVDGFEVLKRLNGDQTVGDLPIIVLSNLGGQEDFNRAKELGASVFLVKALSTPTDILNTIDQILTVK